MEKSVSPHFYSGTSGLVLPIPKYEFPAPFENASRLTYFASLYNSLEVNSSFYKIPKLATTYKWATSVPDDFRFTFKLWQGITHGKGFDFNKEDVEHFMTVIGQVGIKKGCLLIQLPPKAGNHYFGKLDQYRVANGYGNAGDVDGLPANASNPSPFTGTDIASFHLQSMCMENVTPDWLESHGNFNLGNLNFPTGQYLGNGFVSNAAGTKDEYLSTR